MRIRIAAVALAAAALLALAACNDDDTSSKAPAKAPVTTPTAVDTARMEANLGIPPKPTGAALTRYLAAVTAVDPSLKLDTDRSLVDAGRNQCMALHGGAANPDHLAAQRFGNDVHPLSDIKGKALNAALRATLCPK
ncbi:hypothetical protein [Streptomyces sp. NPDC020983]|uniref:hypothetical protein n=1 Tax=Streptomyces sp. NPDC020983 TaxID=3365106 RepID=UPI0037BBEEFB